MKVLLIGASGFIGKKIYDSAPKIMDITGTFFSNKISERGGNFLKLDILDSKINWKNIFCDYECIIISCRPKGIDEKSRTEISIRARDAYVRIIECLKKYDKTPYIIVVNGSLSYGNQGENLVGINNKITPTGFAKSYSIGEAPFREYVEDGNNAAIVRAPWVLGNDSWYTDLYYSVNKVPIFGNGSQWMSIVTVDDLSDYIWNLVEEKSKGVHHPKLSFRCRQKDFAILVGRIKNKEIKKMGFLNMIKMEKQSKESILASIKLDDGFGNHSESVKNYMKIIDYLENI